MRRIPRMDTALDRWGACAFIVHLEYSKILWYAWFNVGKVRLRVNGMFFLRFYRIIIGIFGGFSFKEWTESSEQLQAIYKSDSFNTEKVCG